MRTLSKAIDGLDRINQAVSMKRKENDGVNGVLLSKSNLISQEP